MKKIIGLLLLFIGLFSCNFVKEDVGLTRIKNNGTGGISCLVNGEILRPEKEKSTWSGSNSPKKLSFYYNIYQEDSTYIYTNKLYVRFNNGEKRVFINIHDIKLYNNQTYEQISLTGTIFQLGEYDDRDGTSYGEYSEYGGIYNTTEVINGELEVTYHNIERRILSGTFWFDAVNDEGKIVEIRDGRFDMEIE